MKSSTIGLICSEKTITETSSIGSHLERKGFSKIDAIGKNC